MGIHVDRIIVLNDNRTAWSGLNHVVVLWRMTCETNVKDVKNRQRKCTRTRKWVMCRSVFTC